MQQIKTILFMIVITIVFIASLAIVNTFSQEKILQNTRLRETKSILYAFGIYPNDMKIDGINFKSTTEDLPWDNTFIRESFEKHLRRIKIDVSHKHLKLLDDSFLNIKNTVEIVVRINNQNQPIAYGVPLRGKGLWGTISAFAAIDSSLKKMKGIDFTSQVETPGLGARITEHEFKYYFAGLDISQINTDNSQTNPVVMVREKETSNLEKSTNKLQAITGATQTCDGVLNMVITDLNFYIKLITSNKSAILTQLNEE